MGVIRAFPRQAENSIARAAIVILVGLLLAGCGSGTFAVAPLDADLARETLTDVLESWKQGESQDSLQEHSPPVLVQDFDWMSGQKLLNFELVDDGDEVDGRLVSHVKLTIQNDRGGQAEKTVAYLINTSPGLTVLRDVRQ